MIDTIHGYMELTSEDCINMTIFEHGYIVSSNSGYISTYLNNFRIKVKLNKDGVPVCLSFRGSLPKFYFGNNLAQLDWDTTKEALQMLSDNLHINIFDANLTRIDFGFNFVLDRPVKQYLDLLNARSRFQKITYKNETITFDSNLKSIIFYDKLSEIKARNKQKILDIPTPYKDLNIMRCEVRFKKNIKKNLGLSYYPIKVGDLLEGHIQTKIVKVFFDEFNKIHTSDEIDPQHLLQKRKNGVFNYLSFHGIHMLGFDRVINTIHSTDFNVKDSRSKRSKMKSQVRKILREAQKYTLEYTPIKELKSKIEFIKNLI